MRKTISLLAVVLFVANANGEGRQGLDSADARKIKRFGGIARPLDKTRTEWEVELQHRAKFVNDEALKTVATLKGVVTLNLRDTRISDAGLAHLKPLTDLRFLHLERTMIGDAGLAHLEPLKNLQYLNLYGTKITDQGLQHLAKHKTLRRLYVWNTKVTDQGVDKLQKALPQLKVIRGVDLTKLPATAPKAEEKKPKIALKWIPVDESTAVPKSKNGVNTEVLFENHAKKKVKLYWVSYGGPLKLYAELAPGAKRLQNSYSRNTWLITDASDKPLGYFFVEEDFARAVIPAF